MGMQSIIAALDERHQERLETDANGVVAEASAVRRGKGARTLLLGKDGHVLEQVLRIHGGPDAGAAVFGRDLGEVVIADSWDDPNCRNAEDRGGYGPVRFVGPEGVRRVAAALEALPDAPLPRPDPDGYAADPRADTDARIRAVSKVLHLHGPDPESPERMAELEAVLTALVEHYRRAAEQGHGMLLFLT
jgi:hypothetical protein